MKLKFFGAAGFVTGSCHMIIVNGKKFLIDCGMYQGRREITKKNYEEFKFNPKEISCMILTHAHIDHSGLIPKLYNHGFRGPVYATKTTRDLCRIMLEDSAHIQEMEVKYDNRWLKRHNRPLRKPLYTTKDADACMSLFRDTSYGKMFDVIPGVKAIFRDAGHIIGSCIVEVFVNENKESKKIVFSGDLGQIDMPIIRDPVHVEKADYVVIESTYGGRIHETIKKKNTMLMELIHKTYENKGKLLIPCFAVERTQEILYRINYLAENKLIPRIKMYVDSPLGVKATKVFREHTECYDEETHELLARGDDPFVFPDLRYTTSVDESKRLNTSKEPCVIIASSGMCTGGRIKHHIRNHISKKNTTILFVGYQAEGTLGRRIREGAKFINIYKERIPVKAKVRSIGGFSSHADKPQLINWLKSFKTNPNVFIVHGEPLEAKALSKEIKSRLKFKTHIAKLYEAVELF